MSDTAMLRGSRQELNLLAQNMNPCGLGWQMICYIEPAEQGL